MQYLVLFFALILYPIASYTQIIDQIKDASDNHTEASSSSSSAGSDDNYYDSNDDYYYYDDSYNYYQGPYGQADPLMWLENKRADSNYKFSAINLLYRQSTSSGQVSFFIPEVQIKLAAFYSSIRINTMIEEGASSEDQFQTIDFQFFGFQTNPKGKTVFNLSAGIVGEQYSGKTFAEGVVGLRFQPTNRVSVAWEGRLAGDELVKMRTENSFVAAFAIIKNEDVALEASAFSTSALYYEEVRVKGFGFGIGLRF